MVAFYYHYYKKLKCFLYIPICITPQPTQQSNSKMSSTIASLYLPRVEMEHDANFIIDTFYCLNIATVRRVTLIPYISKRGIYCRAYVDIWEWHDTEVAYNYIKKLTENKLEVRLVHTDDDWWVLRMNENPFVTSDPSLEKYTHVNALLNDDICDMYDLTHLKEEQQVYPTRNYDEEEWRSIEHDLMEMNKFQNWEEMLCN